MAQGSSTSKSLNSHPHSQVGPSSQVCLEAQDHLITHCISELSTHSGLLPHCDIGLLKLCH